MKRWILGILFALFTVQVGYFVSLPELAALLVSWHAIFTVLLFAVLLSGAALAQGKIMNIVLLVALIARYLYFIV